MPHLRPVLILLVLSLAAPVAAQAPEGLLSASWTFQQKEDGKLSRSFHMAKLTCFQGRCDLEVLSMNQCFQKMFWPKIERFTNDSPDMTVVDQGNAVLIKLQHDTYTALHRLTYNGKLLGGTLKLTGYAGGYTKYSEILGKIINVEYVPVLSKDGNSITPMKLDCDVMVDTIPASK